MKGSAFLAPLKLSLAQAIFSDFSSLIKDNPDAAMSIVLFDFFPFHKLLSVPQNATAFANRGAYGNITFAPGWHDAANDAQMRGWLRMMAKKTRAEFEKSLEVVELDASTRDAVGEYGNHDGMYS